MEFLVTSLLTALVLFLIYYTIVRIFRNDLPFPPGPTGLPIVGFLPFMGTYPPRTLSKLADKYGPIFSIKLGSKVAVVLSEFNVITEAMVTQGDIFAGRPTDLSYDEFEKRICYSIGKTDGRFWQEVRRFIVSTLKDYGMGKLSLEPKITEEVCTAMNELKKLKGQPKDISELIGTSVSNTINLLVFGRRFPHNHPELMKVREGMRAIFATESCASTWQWLPVLRKIAPLLRLTTVDGYKSKVMYLRDFIKRQIDDHLKTHEKGQREDLVHAFISQQEEMTKCTRETEMCFGYESMLDNARIMFDAGTDTTTTMILWVVLFMAFYPEMQTKIQKEIDEVIGDRLPTFSDKNRTPYVEAFLMEVHRFVSIVPLSVIHSTLADTYLNGFHIPKRTHIILNLWRVHHDPKFWKEPEEFNPDRFLDEHDKLIKNPHLIGFGLGKRACPGENLGRMEAYLYVTAMLQQFSFKFPNTERPSKEPVYGLTTPPKPYLICAIPRTDF